MKKLGLFDFFDQRNAVSHLAIIFFSLLVTLIIGITSKNNDASVFSVGLFLMLFIQIEVFIWLAAKLFSDFNFDQKPGEVTKKILIRLLLFLTGCLIASMLIFLIMRYVILWINGGDSSKVLYDFIHVGFRGWFRSTTSGLSIGAIIFIVLLWQSSLQREQKLREEKLIFQNETLKNQVNPHFLFNSLNTLSSLISTHPDTAESFIGRLSSIYRYILENSHKDKVALQSELVFINDYFFLHKIRDDDKILMEISVADPEKYDILPVSLQILVENAIKHNMATRDNPLKISIYSVGDYIAVKNNLQKMSVKLKSTGIGLKNLSERVRLTTGKSLIIEESNTEFTVKIPLIL